MWIPGYRIVRTLGEGGMATVYLAVQENFEREVALKIMSPQLARGDSSYGERFIREARIVAQLNHPHIVAVYDVGVHDGQHYLAMEYVPGSDLKLKRLDLSLAQTLSAVKQIALALEYAHKKGYVHRDIKPENVLLNEDNSRAVLTDFGIARPSGVEGGLTQTGTAIGTPSYMSPEQALGKPLDHRTDLYSLGVVLYFLLVGEVPFTADSAVAVGIKHAVEPVPRLPAALMPFQLIIDKALAKAADKRFQTGAEFAHALDELITKLNSELEQAWRAQLHAMAGAEKAAPAATIISGANPTIAPPTRTPAGTPSAAAHSSGNPSAAMSVARSPATPTIVGEAALVAHAIDRPGGQARARSVLQTPAQPAAKSGKGLLIALTLVLVAAGAAGWLWYQQKSAVATDATAASNSKPAATNDQTVTVPVSNPTTAENGSGSDAGNLTGSNTATETNAAPTEPASDATNTSSSTNTNTNAGDVANAPTQAPVSEAKPEPVAAEPGPSIPAVAETAPASEPVAADPKAEALRKLLADADKRLKAGKLIEPANDNAEALYQQALKLDNKNAAAKDGLKNVGTALAKQGIDASKAGDGLRATMLYERAVVLAPKARDVQLLKQRLDGAARAEQAKPLLAKAKQYETAGALITPANANAYDLYKQAQKIDPASTLALAGLSQVEVKLADEIERLWRKGQVGEASALYAGAKERYPDSKDIADAGKAIVQGANRKPKPKPSDTLDDELQRPEILSLRVSGNPINSLPSDQPTLLVIGTSLHAAFTYQNFKSGSTVVEATLYDDNHQIKLGSKKLTLNYDAGELRFQIDRPVEGFPDGEYFLDLFANGERLSSLPFKIQRADLF
ncbi:protein kinase [Permianibacter sp. IMCC34836]|uniref:serine/threonine-protein kinase n=1 Tax=Permianibacter fluminis TaxID=2738515 RepID=UPI0015570415|nr:serine/threonine-protein kinase [Permianibacter fluminis]NQD35856.1 protein kinase [Permianibacter fluminis]